MRTTVTLDRDVEKLLQEAMHEQRKSFKATINDAIRQGLLHQKVKPKPFKVKPWPLGLRPGIDPTRFNQLVDELEVEAQRAKL